MTDIIFEAYVGPATINGTGDGTLPMLQSLGFDTYEDFGAGTLPALDVVHLFDVIGTGFGTLPYLEGRGFDAFEAFGAGTLPMLEGEGDDALVVPSINAGYGSLPALISEGFGRLIIRGNGDAALYMLQGLGFDTYEDFGAGTMPQLQSHGADVAPSRFFTLLMSPGFAWGTISTGLVSISDTANAFSTISATHDKSCRDTALATTLASSLLNAAVFLTAVGVADDEAVTITLLVLSSVAEADDDPVAMTTSLLTIAEYLVATNAVATTLEAYALIAEIAVAADVALTIVDATLADTAAAADVTSGQLQALMTILDAAAAADAATSTLRVLVLGESVAVADDDVTSQLQTLLIAMSTGQAFTSLRFDGETYTVYAMTVEGDAVSEYQNFDFNSYAVIDNHAYGANDDGLFLLEGDDDAGQPINANLRVGMSDLGTQLMKSVPELVIGYTTDGQMALKVITTSKNKEKRENWYALSAKPRNAVGEDRVQPAKGLHSVYWQFELINIDGADFEFDELRGWRMILNRRV